MEKLHKRMLIKRELKAVTIWTETQSVTIYAQFTPVILPLCHHGRYVHWAVMGVMENVLDT